jgi:hypothetical protein
VDHAFASGALVQVVDVLRDERQLRNVRSQRRDGTARGVRLRAHHRHPPPLVPTSNQIGIAAKAAC